MKTKTLLNKIKRAGFEAQIEMHGPNKNLQVVNGNTSLSFYDQDGHVTSLKTRPSDNYGDDNPMNGNCYNFFHDSMKSAVHALVTDWHGSSK